MKKTRKKSIHDWIYLRKLNNFDFQLAISVFGMYLFFFHTWIFVDFETVSERQGVRILERKEWLSIVPVGYFFSTSFLWFIVMLELVFIDTVDWEKFYDEWGY